MSLSKRKFLGFALAAVMLSACMMLAAVLAVDVHLHNKYGKVGGLNTRGYRGPVLKRKHPQEQRVVVLGGSAAYGYGVLPGEAMPPALERKLNGRRQDTHRPITVANLAISNEGAYAMVYTLQDYAYLDYDVAILYDGYNNLSSPDNRSLARHESPLFKLTGYMPIFPLIFREKAMAIRYGGRLEDAYWGRQTVFKPNLAQRTTAAALERAARIAGSLEGQLGRLTPPEQVVEAHSAPVGCPANYLPYCQGIYAAVSYMVERGKWAVVVTQPYISDDHVQQQQGMRGMLQKEFGDHPRVVSLSAQEGVVDLKDPTLCFDGMHLTAAGNERIAEHLAGPVLNVLDRAATTAGS